MSGKERHPCQGLQELSPSQSVLVSAPKENLPAASEAMWGSTDLSVPYVLLQPLLTPASGLTEQPSHRLAPLRAVFTPRQITPLAVNFVLREKRGSFFLCCFASCCLWVGAEFKVMPGGALMSLAIQEDAAGKPCVLLLWSPSFQCSWYQKKH